MSNNYAISLKRSTTLVAVLILISMLTLTSLGSIFSARVGAAQLSERKLTLSSTRSGTIADGAAGSETNGAAATHTFNFNTTDSSVSTVVLTYCTNAIGTCTAPDGLLLDDASDQGTVVVASNVATITLSSAWNTNGAKVVNLTNVKNPTYATPTNPDDNTFFVRIVAGDDEGTVASAVTEGIQITSRVAETLGFSTTAEIDNTNVPAEGSNCAALTGSGAIQLGDPTDNTLSITTAFDAYSAFRLYTNSSNGVLVQYQGDTLTKGTDTIAAIGGTAASSTVGEEQFGLAVAQTKNAQTGAGWDNLDSTWTTDTAGELELATNYAGGDGDIADGGSATFAFDATTPATAKTIAQSDTAFGGYVTCASAAVRYIGNISPLTAAGTYNTTIVYSAVPTY